MYEKVHVPFSFVVGSEIILGEVESCSITCRYNEVCIELVDGTRIYTTINSQMHEALKREYQDSAFDRRVTEIVHREIEKVLK